ncbi:hypothetical protein GF352_00365 [archaeon]|nr:hypothetical protein [archaeon]
MKVFDYIKGFQTYIRDEGLFVKVNNESTAWQLKNKVELEGYSVNLEKNKDHYVISIYGSQLMDAYLLKNLASVAS